MTFRELHLAIFRREPVDRVLWQPRLEHWLRVNRHQDTLPPAYADLSDLQVYDDLNCSVRGYRRFNPCLQIRYSEEVQITHEETPDGTLTTTRTPVGTVTTFRKRAALSTAWTEFPLKTAADIPIIEYLLEHQQVAWDPQYYEQQNELPGDRPGRDRGAHAPAPGRCYTGGDQGRTGRADDPARRNPRHPFYAPGQLPGTGRFHQTGD